MGRGRVATFPPWSTSPHPPHNPGPHYHPPVTQGNAAPADPPILAVRDLTVRFRDLVALDRISFTIPRGQSLGLVGESGSGKSTAGRAVLGLVPAHAGSIVLGGHAVVPFPTQARHRAAIRRSAQMVFQDPAGSLNPRLPLWITATEPLRVQRLETKRPALRDRAAALFASVGLPKDHIDRFPHQLSGGQRQRVAIARALSTEPALIVCDEPTSALDVSIQAQVINLLMDLQRTRGIAYLFISHDIAVVNHVCPRIAVLRRGVIVEEGPREQIINNPREPYTQQLIAAVPRRPAA